jgi:hypothetical protein
MPEAGGGERPRDLAGTIAQPAGRVDTRGPPSRNKRNAAAKRAANSRQKKASRRTKAGAASVKGDFSDAEINRFYKIKKTIEDAGSLDEEEARNRLGVSIREQLGAMAESKLGTERGASLFTDLNEIVRRDDAEDVQGQFTAEMAEEIIRALSDANIGTSYAALNPEEKEEAEGAEEAEAEAAEAEAAEEAAEAEYEDALNLARTEEAKRTEAMRALCTGRIPINPVLIKARIDPAACFGEWYQSGRDYPAEYHACPPNVPLFTTACGIKHMMESTGRLNSNGKRTRTAGSEMILPVVAHIPSAARVHTLGCNMQTKDGDEPEMQLLFVGISYGAVSKTSLVTVASGGQMPIPHEYGRDNFYKLLGAKVKWARSKKTYGDIPDFRIAVPLTKTDYENDSESSNNDYLFADLHEASACRMVVQQATMMDCAVLLGT